MAGLNPLVDKIRTAHPGAYDDMDDAALTKAVLNKYPQYSDMAGPGISAPTNPIPEPPPTAGSRFQQSFGQALGAPSQMSDYVEGPKQMLTHPLDSMGLIGKAILNAQRDTANQGFNQIKQGQYVGGAANVLYGGLPLIGPLLSKAGEQFKQGDIAGGVGTTAGAALPIVAGSPEVRAGAGAAVNAYVKPVARAVGNTADVLTFNRLGKILDAAKQAHGEMQAARTAQPYTLTPGPREPVAKPTAMPQTVEELQQRIRELQGQADTSVGVGKLPKTTGDPYANRISPPMQPMQSGQLSLAGYHPDSQTLVVQFKNGRVYDYKGVPPEIYQQMQDAESQGSFFHQNIKGRYATNLRGSVGTKK